MHSRRVKRDKRAVDKLKSIVTTAIAESIAAYKAEKAKQEAPN